jgi:hypothetical protein
MNETGDHDHEIDPFDPWGQLEPMTSVAWPHGELKVGDSVRLRPRPGADILDLALRDKTAKVESIVQDFDDKIQVAVILDDDPGADLGVLRVTGHRFFFSLEEVEPP